MEKEKAFHKAVVIFIDILGTKNRTNFDELYKINNIFHTELEKESTMDSTHSKIIYKRKIYGFSDCAYIIYDYNENIDTNKIDYKKLCMIACYNTEKICFKFLSENFIFRGAVTIGDVYYEQERNICFGTAINTAYSLESTFAKYPRIIIDPEIAKDIQSYINQKYSQYEFSNGNIFQLDTDGFYYLNMLNSVQLGYYQQVDEKLYENLTSLCLEEKNKNSDKPSILEKYKWLESYIEQSMYKGIRTEDIDITNPETMQKIAKEEQKFINMIKYRGNKD